MSIKYHLITYGCQMNKNDSEKIESLLDLIGMEKTDNSELADFILVNSCSVRQTAEDRVFGQMVNFAKYKEKRPNLVLAITGCMPGRDRDNKLRSKLPDVDFFFPITDLPKLPRLLAQEFPELISQREIDQDYLNLHSKRENFHQGYVTIQTGCEKFCTYCVVPFARGKERSRNLKNIIEEIESLRDKGYKGVTLLGQTVNSYKAPDPHNFSSSNPYHNHFAKLLWEINQIDGIRRIHFTAPHPLHMDDEVIDALSLPKQVNFLHLPVQSGDNEILRKMNRRYTREYYLDLIQKIKKNKPNIALGTDIIVGFCGETEEQFEQTIDLYKQCDFDIAYIAKYSARSGTAATKIFKDDISKEEKRRRWRILQDLQEEITLRKNKEYINKIVEVMVDKFKDGEGQGLSREMKQVQFSSKKELKPGDIIEIKITDALTWLLIGK